MNRNFSKFGISMLLSGGMLLGLVGCSDPQKQALKGVEAKGYQLTVKDFLVAAAAGDVEGLAQFQAAGMEIDSIDGAGNTALIKAASAGQLEAVERILGMGADPRKANGAGRDALISAAGKGHEAVARMLLSRGADTALRDSEGWGALSLAAYNGHADVVSLLASNATPTELDDALLVASFKGDPKVINTLLGQGANINSRSPESKTPLMIASEAGKLDAVQVLLQNQANPYAVDLNNQTAANLALSAGHQEVNHLITHPDTWGRSPEGEKVAGEMANARMALAEKGVEETLLPGKPLSGEPNRNVLVKSASKENEAPSSASAEKAAPQAPQGTVAKRAEAEKQAPVVAKAEAPISSNAPVASASNAVDPKPEAAPVAVAPVAVAPKATARAQEVRALAASKPIVALNGSTIHSRMAAEAPVKTMVLAAYHEESLPIIVDGVSGSTASVRRLDSNSGSLVVEEGAVIPGTPYRVREVSSRYVSSKEGKGRMVDVSRVTVENTESGATHLLVKDVSGQTADTYAILVAPDSQYRYVVKAGDSFRTTQPEVGAKDYQVLDIRANAVVIKDLATDEVVTVARDGVASF
ncbi:MAG TPA: ankyrin repeat domain-containing protein [Bacteroidia bacterium]|nr:ankyrin repeat domain-containing protein [Bacteroidia bacterium]